MKKKSPSPNTLNRKQIYLLSPYHSGSHKAWAEGYQKCSQHQVHLATLPGQLWKWRMHGAAVTFARQFLNENQKPDLIMADDMLDLATFLALTRKKTADLPVVLYMHENQLTYPLPKNTKSGPMRRNMGLRERQYVLINWKAQLAADAIFFNSQHHHDVWFEALPRFLKHYRDHNELESIPELRGKSQILPVGIDMQRLKIQPAEPTMDYEIPPLIVWNQRWEFDKNPALFFKALSIMKTENRPFKLALCGQNFQREPTLFNEAKELFADELIHIGYADSATYKLLLQQAEITISTADHEFFGISILEAVSAKTFPLLPHRLSYPELIPATFHQQVLYKSFGELLSKLRWVLDNRPLAHTHAVALADYVIQYDWMVQTPIYDQLLAKIA